MFTEKSKGRTVLGKGKRLSDHVRAANLSISCWFLQHLLEHEFLLALCGLAKIKAVAKNLASATIAGGRENN